MWTSNVVSQEKRSWWFELIFSVHQYSLRISFIGCHRIDAPKIILFNEKWVDWFILFHSIKFTMLNTFDTHFIFWCSTHRHMSDIVNLNRSMIWKMKLKLKIPNKFHFQQIEIPPPPYLYKKNGCGLTSRIVFDFCVHQLKVQRIALIRIARVRKVSTFDWVALHSFKQTQQHRLTYKLQTAFMFILWIHS